MPTNRYSGDVFGKKISDSTRNDGDLAGHYPYSQERWRLFETDLSEANRIFLEYNQDARYQHQGMTAGVSRGGSYDVHTITPDPGDTLYFKTSERFRYVVGYESRATWAFSISQALQGGDEFEIGIFSNFGGDTFEDGYGFYFDSDLGQRRTDFRLYRGGTVQNNQVINLSTPITEFQRVEWRYAWYNIMGCLASQSYDFKNFQIGSIRSGDNQRGPQIGNFSIAARMKTDSTTNGLSFHLGSAAWQTWGDVDVITREKVTPNIGLSVAANTNYQILAVYRKDPNRSYIKCEIDEVNVKRFTGNADFFALAMIMSSQNVRDAGGNLLDDTDFSTPPEVSQTNSVLQRSFNGAQFPDSTGTLVTDTADPGGYQVGWGSLYTSTGSGTAGAPLTQFTKRSLNNGDYLVLLGRPRTATSGTATIEIKTEQDW